MVYLVLAFLREQSADSSGPKNNVAPLNFKPRENSSSAEIPDYGEKPPVVMRPPMDGSPKRRVSYPLMETLPASPVQSIRGVSVLENFSSSSEDGMTLMDLAMGAVGSDLVTSKSCSLPVLENRLPRLFDGVSTMLAKSQSRLLLIDVIEEISDETRENEDVPNLTEEDRGPMIEESTLIEIAVFLIAQFFVQRNNSFLHNAVLELVTGITQLTKAMPTVIRKSGLVDQIMWSRCVDRGDACYWGQIQKLTKLMIAYPDYVPLDMRERWKEYVTEVSEPYEAVAGANYGGNLAEIQKIFFAQGPRVLCPDP
jgi:hypothetical protein